MIADETAALDDSGLCERRVIAEKDGQSVLGRPSHLYNKKFMWENDVGISDRDYTNGMKWERYLYPGCVEGLGRVGRSLAKLHDGIPDGDNAGEELRVTLGYAYGMNFYTPGDLAIAALQPADRPYSGWAYVALISERQYAEPKMPIASDSRLEVMLGVLGDWAQQDHVQENWHNWIDATDPVGWHNQHNGTVGFNVAYNRRFHSYALKNHAQATFGFGGNIGNVRTEISGAIGIAITTNPDSWGYFNTDTIGPSVADIVPDPEFGSKLRRELTPAQKAATQRTRFAREHAALTSMRFFTFSVRFEPRYKGYDYFLEETPRTGFSTFGVERYVYDAVVSLDFKIRRLPRVIIAVRDVTRSREIDSPFGEHHRFRQVMWRKYFP